MISEDPPLLKRRLRIGVLLFAACSGLLFLAAYLLQITSPQDATTTLKPKGLSVKQLLFTPDGKNLIVASSSMSTSHDPLYYESELSVWDLASNKKQHSIPTPHWIRSLSLSKQGDLLAIAVGGPKVDLGWVNDGKPRQVRLYSFPAMKELGKLESEQYIPSAQLSPDGKLLAMVCMSDTFRDPAEVHVLEVPSLKRQIAIKDLENNQTQVRFAPDGKTFVASDFLHGTFSRRSKESMNRLGVYNAETGKRENNLSLQGKSLHEHRESQDFLFSADGKSLIVDGSAVLTLDLTTGEERKLFDEPRHVANRRLALSGDGKWLVCGFNMNMGSPRLPPRIRIWDLEAKKAIKEWIPKDQQGIGPIAISPDKKTVAMGSDQVYLFEISGK